MDWSLLVLTVKVGAVATLINIPVALGISWLIVKKKVRGSFILDLLVSVPLATPPVAIGFFILLILSREGPIGMLTYNLLGTDLVFTWVAAALASAVVSFPLMARPIMLAMDAVDEQQEMAARTLGAGPVKIALAITLPLTYRGILAGVMLGFIRALSEFGATITVAGNIPGKTQTLALAIYSNVQLREDAAAFRLIGVSIFLTVVTLLIHNFLLRQTGKRTGTDSNSAR